MLKIDIFIRLLLVFNFHIFPCGFSLTVKQLKFRQRSTYFSSINESLHSCILVQFYSLSFISKRKELTRKDLETNALKNSYLCYISVKKFKILLFYRCSKSIFVRENAHSHIGYMALQLKYALFT